MILVLGLTSWPVIARVVRARDLVVGRREFVDAARALGAPESRILIRHVLPNAVPAAFVVISLNAASVILLEAGLGFLGLGDPRVMSWGYLANNAQRFLRVAWWMALFPGAADRARGARPEPARRRPERLLESPPAIERMPEAYARA